MPQLGRPIKGDSKKDKTLQLRVSQGTLSKLHFCAEKKKISRTEVIEQGIDLIFDSLNKE